MPNLALVTDILSHASIDEIACCKASKVQLSYIYKGHDMSSLAQLVNLDGRRWGLPLMLSWEGGAAHPCNLKDY